MARRIFISYQHDDKLQAQGFNLLRWNPNVPVEFVGRHLISPVDSRDPDYIKSKIREQMNGTSLNVVLIGQKTARSKWVDFEIRESIKQGKAILGIRLKGAENAPIPPALLEAGAKVIHWNPDAFPDEFERACLITGRPELGAPLARSASGTTCIRS